MRHRTLKVVIFLVLTIATVLVGLSYDRYEPVGPELLVNADFSQGLDVWRLSGPAGAITLEEPGTVRLNSGSTKTHVSVTQPVEDPRRFALVRLSGDMRTENVVAGERNWHKARLIMSSFDGKGQWVPAPHHVNSLIGTHPWMRYEEVFRIVPEAGQVQVSAQLDRAMGTLWLRNLSLREVIQKPAYAYVQGAVYVLWAIFLVWLLAPSVVGRGRILWRGMTLVSVVLVLAGTLLPGGYRREIEKDLLFGYQSIAASNPSQTAAPPETVAPAQKRVKTIELWERISRATKSGHFVLFGLLGFSLAGALPFRPRRLLVLDIAMLAVATEVLQFFVEGRTPLPGDWGLDLGGAALGLALMSLWERFTER